METFSILLDLHKKTLLSIERCFYLLFFSLFSNWFSMWSFCTFFLKFLFLHVDDSELSVLKSERVLDLYPDLLFSRGTTRRFQRQKTNNKWNLAPTVGHKSSRCGLDFLRGPPVAFLVLSEVSAGSSPLAIATFYNWNSRVGGFLNSFSQFGCFRETLQFSPQANHRMIGTGNPESTSWNS